MTTTNSKAYLTSNHHIIFIVLEVWYVFSNFLTLFLVAFFILFVDKIHFLTPILGYEITNVRVTNDKFSEISQPFFYKNTCLTPPASICQEIGSCQRQAGLSHSYCLPLQYFSFFMPFWPPDGWGQKVQFFSCDYHDVMSLNPSGFFMIFKAALAQAF